MAHFAALSRGLHWYLAYLEEDTEILTSTLRQSGGCAELRTPQSGSDDKRDSRSRPFGGGAAALHGRRPRGCVAGIECHKDTDVIDEASVAYKLIDAVMAAQKDLVEVVHTLHALRDDAVLTSMAVPCQDLIRARETRIQPRERKPRSFKTNPALYGSK
jgi:tRNA-splicing ligase RtcB